MRAADRSDGLASASQELLQMHLIRWSTKGPEMGISSFPIQCIMAEVTARTPSGGIRTVGLPIGPV